MCPATSHFSTICSHQEAFYIRFTAKASQGNKKQDFHPFKIIFWTVNMDTNVFKLSPFIMLLHICLIVADIFHVTPHKIK